MNLLVIAEVKLSIGKSWVRPLEGATTNVVSGVNQMSTAQFFIALRRHASDDQFTHVIQMKIAVFVPNGKHVRR